MPRHPDPDPTVQSSRPLRPRRSMLQLFTTLPGRRERSRSNPPRPAQVATELAPPSRPGATRPPSYATVSSIPPYTPFLVPESAAATNTSGKRSANVSLDAPHALEGSPYPRSPRAHRRAASTNDHGHGHDGYEAPVPRESQYFDAVETLFTPVKVGATPRAGGPRYPAPSGPLPPVPTPTLRRVYTVQGTPRSRARAQSEVTPGATRDIPLHEHSYDPHKRQVVLLINDGVAMAPYWARLLTELGATVSAAEDTWQLGIDVFFLNSANYGRGLTHPRELLSVFDGVRPVGPSVTPDILRRRIVKMVSSYGPSWAQLGDDGMRVLKLLLYVGDWCYSSEQQRPVTLLKRLQRSHTNSLVSNMASLERYLE
ncbi:uncharacterized protein LOC62_05G007549 [Vanrija pseudolonga]|uniref:Uncharacterized protein n=1 Tax=Vanrija pseudolonga TaxID=143232 RepID=A0AAF1BKI9_9TREE|nr:hypothetical protein LOC62_05G007549 [Vanrija pseudolonga]